MSDIDLRSVMGEFATGVTAVTLNGDQPHGITVNAFSSVSLDPPLVLVCLDHGTEAHDQLQSGEADGYCVNILAADQQILGEHFADMAEEDIDPFEDHPTTTAETGAPVFSESLGYVDCSIHEAVEAGDHTIYIGHVEAAEQLEDGDALTFFEGEWGTLGGE
ncbi:flavin reductase [Halovenus sp. WSH3]|uniref:Flavin reductase n=1 Tax=Halovenus carboxidivorans TaxID=2692199 RepID=A0A6B0T3I7_9EURY|nr:flavin reductase family protein [Halovenus carboxidivorans]MXR50033.1 flavin reductase [Halovenus carboxidivorans]